MSVAVVTRLIVLAAVLAAVLATAAGAARAETPSARLLATFEPMARFDPLEPFRPTKVQSFLADADLEQLVSPGTWAVVDSDPEPGELPGPGTGIWRLNQDSCTPAANVGGLDCYAAAAPSGSGGQAVYGRVVREDGRTVLQYWFFYYDDVYSYTYPASNLLWQAHEGDWEVVNVVLDGDERPVEVGYSQHCLGERRSWADTPRQDDTHPIVHVAFGSHANYFTAGTHRLDARCIPPQALAILRQQGLPLPVDYAFDGGDVAGPAGSGATATTIHQIDDDGPSWVAFPGFWGELQYFHAPPPIGTVAFGTAPVGPAYHAVWTNPLGTLAAWPSS